MDFKELAASRYSVRKFKQTPVKTEELELILAAGRNCPTAANKQPQRILAITQAEGLEKIDRCTPFRFQAPVALLVCFDKTRDWERDFDGKRSGWVDASIATAQMMLQAADLGLGATWVMHFDPVKIRAEFGLPENMVPVALLPLGYPATNSKPSRLHEDRLPSGMTVFFEHF